MPKKDPVIDAQIHSGRREKLRQSLLKFGLHTFNETQVLEFALGIAIPRMDTNPAAHRLMNTFGSLNAVIEAHPDKLKKVEGIGEQAAFFLYFLRQFVTYSTNLKSSITNIKTPQCAVSYLRDVMATYSTEEFVVLCLDKSGGILLREQIRGTINRVNVDVRSILDSVMRVNATAVVLAHNHLGESATPSAADIHLTRLVVNLLSPLEIDVVDHIIFSKDTHYSFTESGLIKIFKQEHKAYATSMSFEELL